MEESEDKRGFKVQDRRRFSSEGEAKEGVESSSDSAPETKPHPEASASERPQPAATAGARPSSEPPPELTFAAFLWSLSEQALAALGEIPDPVSNQPTRDLMMAQQMIDIIIMLREKTKGNLDPNEQALLKEILSGLQMKYVEVARQPNR